MKECKDCNGSGLIPLKDKNGVRIPYAWKYCRCHQEPLEVIRPLSPADFDFPCSDTFRGFYFEEFAGHDPAYVPPRLDDKEIAELKNTVEDLEALMASQGQIPRKYHDALQQIKSNVLHLQSKVSEYLGKKKQEKKEQKPVISPDRLDVTDKLYR